MSTDRLKMQDPRSQHPKPPFKTPEQPAPGLTSKMDPRPDHGEDSYQGSGKLEGRKALVTGADSGIGRAVAIAFAREGADVALSYLPHEGGDAAEVVKIIEAEGRTAVALPGDITDEAFCQKLVADAVKGLGGLDILVNNAGAMDQSGGLNKQATDSFDRMMKTNLYALVWITKAAMPHLKAGASVINTASIQAYDPSLGVFAYAMTKAGIVSFTKAISQELMEQGVRVNAVAPGPFWTPIQPQGQPPAKVATMGASTTFGRPGQPVEAAPLYVLLASQEGSYLTGEIFGITGGDGIA